MATKRTAGGQLLYEGDEVEIIPLGAGQEVGRSCVLLRYRNKTVMFDCGMHPGRSGRDTLPDLHWNGFDISDVDACLVTHFHNDHCAAVPYLVGRLEFRGRLFMTHPTKAIYHHVMRDVVQMNRRNNEAEALFSEEDLDKSLKRVELIDFHQTIDVDGIKITAYMAGHVLGAAMFLVEIDGLRVLYTGDYSRHPDRHMPGAEIPDRPPHVVIVEATYGVSSHLARAEREKRFLDKVVETVVTRKGRVLLPVVALGRAQELLMLLEQYWERNHEAMKDIPVFQISSMAVQAMPVYQSYIEMMNEDVKRAFKLRNPFLFNHIRLLDRSAQLDDWEGPCVVLATPSTMMSGTSRELFERWCEDERNGLIIADFAVQGTMAREVLAQPRTITSREGRTLHLRMSVEAISFSAHADFPQTSEFLDILAPPHVVLVHGEKQGMERLGKELEARAKQSGQPRNVYMPANLSAVSFRHVPERIARVVGRLAEKGASEGRDLRGILVRRGAEDLLVHPDDLGAYTRLRTVALRHRQRIPLAHRSFADIRFALEATFEGVVGVRAARVTAAAEGAEESASASSPPGAEPTSICVGGRVTVSYQPESAALPTPTASGPKSGGAHVAVGEAHVLLEWEAGSASDMLADGIVSVILQAKGEPKALVAAERARKSAYDSNDLCAANAAELRILAQLLGAQFGHVEVEEATLVLTVYSDGKEVRVDYREGTVTCEEDGALRDRVERAVERTREAMRPLALYED